jgi:hypothetical protein
MTSPSTTFRSRRSLLAGLAGAAATAVAASFGQARPAAASHDGAVLLGHDNSTDTLTSIHRTTGGFAAFQASHEADFGDGILGSTTSGIGVIGDSTLGTGVGGSSNFGVGVGGITFSATKPAVLGHAEGGNSGVQGYSGPNVPPASPAKTGVFGYAAQDTSARGVTGQTTVGRGVDGVATSGIAGHFEASPSGTALKAVGRVLLSTAGLTSVAVGTKSVTVTPRSDLATTTTILCTLESNQSGLSIQRVTKDTSANTFRVFLSANVLTGKYARVAWFVIG